MAMELSESTGIPFVPNLRLGTNDEMSNLELLAASLEK